MPQDEYWYKSRSSSKRNYSIGINLAPKVDPKNSLDRFMKKPKKNLEKKLLQKS